MKIIVEFWNSLLTTFKINEIHLCIPILKAEEPYCRQEGMRSAISPKTSD